MRNVINNIDSHKTKPLYSSTNSRKTDKTINPEKIVEKLLMEHFGVLPLIVRRNSELISRLTDFFIGNKDILIIGGESGMGKSLIAGDIRRVHEDLQPYLDFKLRSEICVISWDRAHQAFFEEVSTEVGETISVPKGETHSDAREIISSMLEDQIMFVKKYSKKNIKILLETPLIGKRGEKIFDSLKEYRDKMQVIIMHSPMLRYQTLQEGRLMLTSGQPDAMGSMREQLLYQILGKVPSRLSQDAKDNIIKNWWSEKVKNWDGIVADWNFEDDKKGYDESVRYFMEIGIKPDVLRPRYLSYYTRRQYESIFMATPHLDKFISKIIS